MSPRAGVGARVDAPRPGESSHLGRPAEPSRRFHQFAVDPWLLPLTLDFLPSSSLTTKACNAWDSSSCGRLAPLYSCRNFLRGPVPCGAKPSGTAGPVTGDRTQSSALRGMKRAQRGTHPVGRPRTAPSPSARRSTAVLIMPEHQPLPVCLHPPSPQHHASSPSGPQRRSTTQSSIRGAQIRPYFPCAPVTPSKTVSQPCDEHHFSAPHSARRRGRR